MTAPTVQQIINGAAKLPKRGTAIPVGGGDPVQSKTLVGKAVRCPDCSTDARPVAAEIVDGGWVCRECGSTGTAEQALGNPGLIFRSGDQAGSPWVIDPQGKVVRYRRPSSFGKLLEDGYLLHRRDRRSQAAGAVATPLLLLEVEKAILGGARIDDLDADQKDELDLIVDAMLDSGGALEKAHRGTALHRCAEHVDKALPADQAPPVPENCERTLAARAELMKALDIRWLGKELCVINDARGAIGAVDGIAVVTLPAAPEPGHENVPEHLRGQRVIVGSLDDKGLALDTAIPTPFGWTTMGSVAVGDRVFDADGNPCTVIRKSETKSLPTFIVEFDDTSKIVCDNEHLWWTYTTSDRADVSVRPVTEVRDTLMDQSGRRQHKVPIAGALRMPEADLPVDPYLLGCWLGDGRARGGEVSKGRDLFDILAADGHQLGVEQRCGASESTYTRTILGLTGRLRAAGVLNDKHIPDAYLRASIDQRIKLLQGLMDTDGHWNFTRKRASFHNCNKRVALAVHELASSLGLRANFREHLAHGYGLTVTAYKVEFRPAGFVPFRLPRKAEPCAKSLVDNGASAMSGRRLITSITPGPDVPTACIAVDSPTRTYLCGEAMIPTHNTGQSLSFSEISYGVQQAIYAGAQLYNPVTGERVPLQSLVPADETAPWCDEIALLIHCPATEDVANLVVIDLAEANIDTDLAERVMARRAAAKGRMQPAMTRRAPGIVGTTALEDQRAVRAEVAERAAVQNAEPGPAATTTPSDPLALAIAEAPSYEALAGLWTANQATWTQQHTELAAARKALLAASLAA